MAHELARYEAALKAIAEARRVDEVKEIRDKAVAVKAYAQQIKDVPMLTTAAEIIFRAQVKAGRILIEMAKNGERAVRQNVKSQGAISKLSDLGISLSQSSRWQALYRLPQKQQDQRRRNYIKKLVSATDGTGKRERAEMKLADEARVMALRPVEGKFKTLVIDPPWDYEWLSLAGRAKPGYATMTHEQLLKLNVRRWAEEDCHMYLWVTNNFITRGVELMETWGFQHKTVLTWVKQTKNGKQWFGLGAYFRNSTEHVLFGTRGQLKTRPAAMRIPTHFYAPIAGHSEKPERFYELVRKSSYMPCGELFQRKARDGFVNVFQATQEEDVAA